MANLARTFCFTALHASFAQRKSFPAFTRLVTSSTGEILCSVPFGAPANVASNSTVSKHSDGSSLRVHKTSPMAAVNRRSNDSVLIRVRT